MEKHLWEDAYEGEPLPVAFKTRLDLDTALSIEEQAVIRALGVGIVVEDELFEKAAKLLWGI